MKRPLTDCLRFTACGLQDFVASFDGSNERLQQSLGVRAAFDQCGDGCSDAFQFRRKCAVVQVDTDADDDGASRFSLDCLGQYPAELTLEGFDVIRPFNVRLNLE